MKLAGKKALITGGNSGIGLATARLFIAEGAEVAITGRDQKTLDEAIAELGPMTVAVLRAELGDLDRFAHMDQVVAYAGLDLQVKQSGKWKGQTKLSKRGSGHLRRILYLAALRSIRLPTSPFGIYYRRLVDSGMKKGMAVTAVMRKLLIVAAHLIRTQQVYDPAKVAAPSVG